MMASYKRILIKGATVLTIDPLLGNQENCDILIENDIIKSIGPDLPLEDDTEIIDGSECIITPGFVDGHHHMWQQLLRTVATDWSLFEYFSQMRTKYASLYTVEDVYFANYAAAVNLLNNGVTCVLDHCHIMNSPAHADAAVKGLQDSGIRGTFCYGFYENPVNVEGGTVATNWDQKARESDAKRVREQHFPNNDPEKTVLTFGISPNEAQAIPTKQLIDEIKFSRSVGARIITAHVSMGNGDVDNKPIVQLLSDAGILGPDLLFSHGSAFTDSELAAIRESGAGICATPDTELQMGMGHPVAFRTADARCRTCLGLDITSSQGNDFVAQMRLMLQVQRAHENRGRFPLEIKRKTAEVLRMGTLGGAEAMRLENITGSITPGKKADLVMFRCDDINTVPCVNPVGEVVFHTSPQNIDTVIVNGRIVKRDGKLIGIDWPMLREELRNRCERIITQGNKVDLEPQIAKWKPLFKGQVVPGKLKL